MYSTPISLLQRLRQPDAQPAWRQFVDLYTPLLYYWALRLNLQKSDAADLVQDVLLVLVQKLPEFEYDRRKSFRSWMRTILVNKWRTRRRGPARVPGAAGEAVLDAAVVPPEIEAFSEAEYQQYVIRRALELMQAEFQPTTWKACWEMTVNGRPAADVAAELGISEGAAYVAKSRVLRRLKQQLAGLLDE
jgi:RNA polymerase sigma-70 factor (ECF subfamily)